MVRPHYQLTGTLHAAWFIEIWMIGQRGGLGLDLVFQILRGSRAVV